KGEDESVGEPRKLIEALDKDDRESRGQSEKDQEAGPAEGRDQCSNPEPERRVDFDDVGIELRSAQNLAPYPDLPGSVVCHGQLGQEGDDEPQRYEWQEAQDARRLQAHPALGPTKMPSLYR